MVQTVRILNIDWIESVWMAGWGGGSSRMESSWMSWLLLLQHSLAVAVIFMRHVFICIYYCVCGEQSSEEHTLFAGEIFHASSEMRIY